MSDVSPEAIQRIWITTLVIYAVVLIVVAALLTFILRAARDVRTHTNLAHLDVLPANTDLIDVDLDVVGIVVDSKGIAEAAAQCAEVDDGRARGPRFCGRGGMLCERHSNDDGRHRKELKCHVSS